MKPSSDHDLLIELRTEMKALRLDVRELKDDTSSRVASLEQEKFNKEEAYRLKEESDKLHVDYEARLRRLEKWGSMAVGALALIQFVTELYFKQ